MLVNNGDTLNINLVLPALATVQVTVLQANGTPLAGAQIDVKNSINNFFQFAGVTNTSGVLSILNVPEGQFVVEAFAPNNSSFAGDATGTIAPANDGGTVSVTINAPLSGNIQGHLFAVTARPRKVRLDPGAGCCQSEPDSLHLNQLRWLVLSF